MKKTITFIALKSDLVFKMYVMGLTSILYSFL